ncbi:hypothetical protein CMI37_25705 [Candidatus Pacearchaeota archaeon]|nr:hypothetical protein [Candidatus Pacearchaeota archaeon]
MATRAQYEAIQRVIIEALQRGTPPWHKPWNAPVGNALPHNAVTGKKYRGINVFSLWAVGAMNGYGSQAWLSYKQAQKLGGNVRKGEKGTLVQFWKVETEELPELDDKGKPKISRRFVFRMYTIFNVDQCEGLNLPKRELVNDSPVDTFNAIEAAETIAAAYISNGGPTMDHNGGDRAFYVPARHEVHMPKQSQFEGKEEYYSTLFHELAHSTGHKSLLGRLEEGSGPAHFGSERYSKEELVAEFGNAFLCAELGIENKTIQNSAAYIQSWLKVLEADYTMALSAASKAQKAADLILSRAGKDS